MNQYFIGLAGSIGVGKSSLTAILSKQLGWQSLIETSDENPYLDKFYGDMRRWGFHSQVFFLTQKLRQYPILARRTTTVVQDRTIYEDAEVFAKNLHLQGHLPTEDYHLYADLYSGIKAIIPAPDLIVYLRASVDTLLERINLRGRSYESNISKEYLLQLGTLYDAWTQSFDLCRLITIDTDGMDFVQNPESADDILAKIISFLPQKE